MRRLIPAQGTMPGLEVVVPAYFHPHVDDGDWATLAESADGTRLVVLNIDSGPGNLPDPAFAVAADRLRAAGVPVIGYVDTAYGARPGRDQGLEVRRYLDWYGVDGVFLDQVAAGPEQLWKYRRVADDARQLGAGLIVFNHGVYPTESYAEIADLLVTFEGAWTSYRRLPVPGWAYHRPSGQFCHLVYSTPPELLQNALYFAQRRNTGTVYVTDRGGANPWDRLPSYYPAEIAAARAHRHGRPVLDA